MAKLYLIGAGPGDPELITLKAVRILKKADVILYDALANQELLKYNRQDAVLHFVGKRLGNHSLTQEEIGALILHHACGDAIIVRLKGGDPFVFGRAWEEIEMAMKAGLEVEVIPGISSCIAGPSSQMIPLTCRGVAESFWVITGTTHSGQLSSDIILAAKSTATVIILMAMHKLDEILNIFKANGKSDTAAAIIQDATTVNEKVVTGKVHTIATKAQDLGFTNPAVVVIGDVVTLHLAGVKQLILENNKTPIMKTA